MPEYLAPGVYVEETSFRSKSIAGVSTSTAAFVGATRSGPFAASHPPELLTSMTDFQRVYGGTEDLPRTNPATNHVARAAQAFFNEGGARLYIARIKRPLKSAANWTAALNALLAVEEISTVAAPGATELGVFGETVQTQLIAHASAARAYRFAVLDVPRGLAPNEARAWRDKFNSPFAAFYYPWVSTPGAPGAPEILLPPSGFLCGIYARSDVARGVSKAPANEVIRGAIGFERDLDTAALELLNPAGVNCLRTFPGRSLRVWGARTAASDPEWKYLNVRRYFNYLEHSIDTGTQWAVLAPNGEALWANVRRSIENFLLNEWQGGALLGDKPEKAFFVKCDRSTMTQNDLDQGRLVCLIGVAPVRPAEFVIFRIGQRTADATS